jgi:hypothetical protein
MLKAICELVRKGLSVRHASELLRVHHSTIGRWRNELPDFDAAILAAEAEFIEAQVANIRMAAKTSWQASAWLLERKFPEFYSQPQVQLNLPGAKSTPFEDLQSLLEAMKHSPASQASLARDSLQKTAKSSIIDVPALPAHDAPTE